jgi:hypothetical protein
MNENTKRFVVKPTRMMMLESEKGTNNIRKVYFAFVDGLIWSLEFDGQSIVATDYDSRKQNPMLKKDGETGLV